MTGICPTAHGWIPLSGSPGYYTYPAAHAIDHTLIPQNKSLYSNITIGSGSLTTWGTSPAYIMGGSGILISTYYTPPSSDYMDTKIPEVDIPKGFIVHDDIYMLGEPE